MRVASVLALVATLSVVSLAASPAVAEAQSAPNEVETGYKGVIGLGIMGAELGFVVPALVGLDDTWAFIVFPVVGAAGGALGGYFLLEEPNQVELSVGALMLGMALVIPSMVLTLSATAYDPGDEEGAVQGDEAEPEEEPLSEEDAAVASRDRDQRAGWGLVRLSDGIVRLGVPAVSLKSSASPEETRRYGAVSERGLHVPLLTGSF